VRSVDNGVVTDEPAPARVECHCLITAWRRRVTETSDWVVGYVTDEHALLYQAMMVLMNPAPLNPSRIYALGSPVLIREADLPTQILPVEGFRKYAEFWGTMGTEHRWKPAIYQVRLRVRDVAHGAHVLSRATVVQQKTQQPCAWNSRSRQARRSPLGWLRRSSPLGTISSRAGSPSQRISRPARMPASSIVKGWIGLAGGLPQEHGTHSLRRTKATLIYGRTKNLRAVQLLLGHRKLESTVRYLGIEVDDGLEMAERTEC
jgi:hypothetical protein